MALAMDRLLPQCRRAQAELIVARPAADATTEPEPAFEGGRLVRCRPAATIPEVRGTALAAATGDWVLLTEDNCLAHPDWVAALSAACSAAVDVTGGLMVNAQDARAIDAAAGFAEYGHYGPLQPAGTVPALACANVAYHRRVLAEVAAGSLAGEWENEIHARLARQGARFLLVTDAVVEPSLQHRLGAFCRNRYRHGRGYASARSDHLAAITRLLLACATPLLPVALTWRIWRRAGRAAPRDFVRALPFTLTFLAAWSAGEAAGYVRPGTAA